MVSLYHGGSCAGKVKIPILAAQDAARMGYPATDKEYLRPQVPDRSLGSWVHEPET